MKDIAHLLVLGMDDEHGVKESVYRGILGLVLTQFGEASAKALSNATSSQDGRFFIGEDEGEAVWGDIQQAALTKEE